MQSYQNIIYYEVLKIFSLAKTENVKCYFFSIFVWEKNIKRASLHKLGGE